MATTKVRLFTKRFLILLNILAGIVFLLACLAPYVSPREWWVISFIGLGFALILALLFLFMLFWMFFRPALILISLIPLLIGWKSISVFIALNAPASFRNPKAKNALRVVHWNVARFVEWKRNNNKGSQTRLKMMDQIKKQNADVLCFQEFFHSTDSVYYDNLNFVRKELNYPYYYYSWDDDGPKQYNGQVIFSRYPIVDTGMIRYPRPGLPESLIHADLLFNGDTVRVYTTHLQSVLFKKEDYENIERIKNRDEDLLDNSKSIFGKLRRGMAIRTQQTDMVQAEIARSPHPFIITGDFNDVPNSYTYFTIRKDLQDVFLKKGFGLGRTFSNLSPTLRIDYILTTPDFGVNQFNRIVKSYSDHYMLVADLTLPE